MPRGPLRPCKHPGCPHLTREAYCEAHRGEAEAEAEARRERDQAADRRRGSAQDRGYTSRWARYSKWFLRQPGHQLCALHLDEGCAVVAQCVDHIDPPDGPTDPRFWDPDNHQPACIHCNSVKGHRRIVGGGPRLGG